MINELTLGFFSPFQGLRLILSSPKNMGYALVPFLIGLAIVVSGYVVAFEYLNEWVSGWTQSQDSFKDWPIVAQVINVFLMIFSWIIASIVNFLLGYVVIIVVAGPFYALMVENIFKKELPDKEVRSDLKLVLSMFFVGLLKVVLFAFVGLVCFVLAFIPVVNFLAPLIVVLTVAFDCTDYVFEVDFLKLKERLRFVRQHLAAFVGLSGAILIVGLIPGLFFVLMPIFICGASKMYIQLKHQSV